MVWGYKNDFRETHGRQQWVCVTVGDIPNCEYLHCYNKKQENLITLKDD